MAGDVGCRARRARSRLVLRTLFFGETQIRTGHILTAALKDRELRRALLNVSKEFDKINVDRCDAHRAPRHLLRVDRGEAAADGWLRPRRRRHARCCRCRGQPPMAPPRSAAIRRTSPPRPNPAKWTRSSARDEEIRQIIDVLMRRRQNNPILTGEAGVGKTAVVEGFAQHVASGNVPPHSKTCASARSISG